MRSTPSTPRSTKALRTSASEYVRVGGKIVRASSAKIPRLRDSSGNARLHARGKWSRSSDVHWNTFDRLAWEIAVCVSLH